MPRNIEHIVATHKAARMLKSAGKPIWDQSIDIKAILSEDQDNTTPEHVSAIAVRIAKLIRSKAPSRFFDIGHSCYDADFFDVIENMEECTVAILAIDNEAGCEPEEMLNGWLEVIYDWADNNRIWMGS